MTPPLVSRTSTLKVGRTCTFQFWASTFKSIATHLTEIMRTLHPVFLAALAVFTGGPTQATHPRRTAAPTTTTSSLTWQHDAVPLHQITIDATFTSCVASVASYALKGSAIAPAPDGYYAWREETSFDPCTTATPYPADMSSAYAGYDSSIGSQRAAVLSAYRTADANCLQAAEFVYILAINDSNVCNTTRNAWFADLEGLLVAPKSSSGNRASGRGSNLVVVTAAVLGSTLTVAVSL